MAIPVHVANYLHNIMPVIILVHNHLASLGKKIAAQFRNPRSGVRIVFKKRVRSNVCSRHRSSSSRYKRANNVHPSVMKPRQVDLCNLSVLIKLAKLLQLRTIQVFESISEFCKFQLPLCILHQGDSHLRDSVRVPCQVGSGIEMIIAEVSSHRMIDPGSNKTFKPLPLLQKVLSCFALCWVRDIRADRLASKELANGFSCASVFFKNLWINHVLSSLCYSPITPSGNSGLSASGDNIP